MTPELAATAGGRPCFWKKRMVRVALPAVPPTSPVKALANCTPVDGPERQPGRDGAEHGDRLGDRRELGDHERQQDPAPDRVLEDVAHGGDAGELADEEVDAEGEGGGHEDRAEREAVQLGWLRWFDAGQLRARLAEAGQGLLGLGDDAAWPPP